MRLFNRSLAARLPEMDDDQLWNLVTENAGRVEKFFDASQYPASGFLYGWAYGIERTRELFLDAINEYREGVVFSLALDFCFEGEKINLDYWARCGYLDDDASCDPVTSDDVMPPVDEESEAAYYAVYFHLLDARRVGLVIDAMKKNLGKLTVNSPEDIEKLEAMRRRCLENERLKAAYIFDA